MNLSQWALLFSYPGGDYLARVQDCGLPLAEFAQAIERLPVETLQELFTQTFDWNPDTTLDLGWHLFGENYDRGEFLVKLRGALRAHGVTESQELPDHLSHILLLLDRMSKDEQADFAAKYVLPALGKLQEGLAKTESPFLPLIIALRREISARVSELIPGGANHE